MNLRSILFFAMVLFGGFLRAETKYTDDFEKATVDGGTIKSILEWKNVVNSQVLSLEGDPEGLNTGKALKLSMGRIYTTFAPIELKENETLKLTFQFRYATQPKDSFSMFRIGLYHDEHGKPTDGLSKGYWIMTNPGSPQSQGLLISEQGTDGALGGGTDLVHLGKSIPSDDFQTKPHKITFSATRLAGDSGVEVSYQVDDDSVNSRVDNRPPFTTTFNNLGINISDAEAGTFVLIDNVTLSVETAGTN